MGRYPLIGLGKLSRNAYLWPSSACLCARGLREFSLTYPETSKSEKELFIFRCTSLGSCCSTIELHPRS